MSVLGTFLSAIAWVVSTLLNLYIWVIIIAALISWVRPDPYNPIVQVLNRLTLPVYARLRALIPTAINGIDFAPLIIAIALKFIDMTFISLLLRYAQTL